LISVNGEVIERREVATVAAVGIAVWVLDDRGFFTEALVEYAMPSRMIGPSDCTRGAFGP
jgi:hypothetical protein